MDNAYNCRSYARNFMTHRTVCSGRRYRQSRWSFCSVDVRGPVHLLRARAKEAYKINLRCSPNFCSFRIRNSPVNCFGILNSHSPTCLSSPQCLSYICWPYDLCVFQRHLSGNLDCPSVNFLRTGVIDRHHCHRKFLDMSTGHTLSTKLTCPRTQFREVDIQRKRMVSWRRGTV
jgi:hypothetical protein